MKELQCIIVDDEYLARRLLEKYIEETEGITLVASVQNPLAAEVMLESQNIDIVFLDIQMPQMKGTTLAGKVQDNCHIIFTTAYPQYAVESYEYGAVDYLVKPIRIERFAKAIEKVRERIGPQNEIEDLTEITVKSGYDLIRIKLNDVSFIEGMKEYVAFHMNGKRVLTYMTMKSLEKDLPEDQFLRIHRSYIVRLDKITSVKDNKVIIEDKSLPISKSRIKEVKSIFLDQ